MEASTPPVPAFPNYTQIPRRLPQSTWIALRICSIVGALVVAGLLIAAEDTGLKVFWGAIIPALPALFLIAPGVWRNLCPLAASNQTPRVLRISYALTPPDWLKRYGYVIAITLFVGFIVARKFGLSSNGPLSALLLLGALTSGFVGGMAFKGKSGWCSSICPLLPVQRIYAQTPFKLVANNHCQPCVGCAKNCYDFNPKAAYLADLNEPDRHWRAYRTFFLGAFGGLILAFFVVAEPPDISGWEMLGQMALYMAASIAAFQLVDTFLPVSTHVVTTLWAALAFNLFYWYGVKTVYAAWADGAAAPAALQWSVHVLVFALAVAWVIRTWRKERAFVAQASGGAAGGAVLGGAAAKSLADHRARGTGSPEVDFSEEGKRVAVTAGATVLEVAESNGLKIEAGCRMGVCGADPVAIRSGMENLSAAGDDEHNTLARLGFAENTRMACCCKVEGPVEVALEPDKAARPTKSQIMGFDFDRSIERVVVLGNGIAGVTAADHLRRRHPVCHIDLVADEPHPLYNRMGIGRLIYGRSAMQGLYLNPDSWYDEREIEVWLNTRGRSIDREAREVELATGDRLKYDRLILAMGSSSMVPPIEGFGAPGSFVLRSAADALEIRSFAQREGCRTATVAGGGLLGLEAAYALHKLGLRSGVLERSDRLLRRQLDARASAMLQAYLEGLGLEIHTNAETASLSANGRVNDVVLKDGRDVGAEIFIVAAGITPNAGLAADAGLDVGRGVIVDDHMRTTDGVIYAAGDVAEFGGRVPGLWPAAVDQAEVAADNAVGGDKAYKPTAPVTVLKVVGIELTSMGRFEAQDGDEVIALEDETGQKYRKLVISEGRIVGAILLGYSAEASPVATAIKRGFVVEGLLPALRAGDWGRLAGLSGDRPLVPVAPSHPGA